MAMHQDPFLLVRDEIQDALNVALGTFGRYDRLPVGNAERAALEGELVSECDSLLWQLEELDRAIDAAERDFNRFRIEKDELARRRQWTKSTKAQLDDVRAGLRAGRLQEERAAAAQAAARKELRGGGGGAGGGGGLDNIYRRENDAYLGGHSQQQQQLMRQQDEDLDELSASVNRLGQVGLTIGSELEEQGKMLDELEEDVDGTTSRLQAAQRKMVQVIKKSGMRGQLCIIFILLCVLIVLFVVAFS